MFPVYAAPFEEQASCSTRTFKWNKLQMILKLGFTAL